MKLHNAHPAPSDKRLAWFEDVYQVKLPTSYRTFLGQHNGASLEGGATFELAGNERVVGRFLPILETPREAGDAGWYDITVVLTQVEDRLIDDDDIVGTNVVPIAALFAGDLVCLDYHGGPDSEPTVVVWDHEESEEGEPVLEQVAESFEAFLKLL